MVGSCYFFHFLFFFCLFVWFLDYGIVKIYHLEVCYVLLLGTLFSSQGHLTTDPPKRGGEQNREEGEIGAKM